MKIFIGAKYSCALNYQHDLIYEELKEKFEITPKVEDADAIVFASSCACTEDTIIGELNYFYGCIKKKKPGAKVYLTGCLTREFKKTQDFAEYNKWLENNIDFIIPQNQPNLLLQKISPKFNDLPPEDFGCITYNEHGVELHIGNGCLNNCTFCKVYYQNYPLKSVPIEELKESIDKAVDLGAPIIRLIATNLSQYGIDLYREPKLLEIIDYIESKDSVEYIELNGFSYKDAINYNFADSLAQSRKITYISGSLESGSPRLLEMIRKGFTPEEIIEFIRKIKSQYPRYLIINIIAGLPTESLEDVKLTLDVLKEIAPYEVSICEYIKSSYLTHLNSFPQLSDKEINAHRKIYNEVLTRRRVKTRIVYK